MINADQLAQAIEVARRWTAPGWASRGVSDREHLLGTTLLELAAQQPKASLTASPTVVPVDTRHGQRRRTGSHRAGLGVCVMSQVWVSIGNSDDKLTQAQWSELCGEVIDAVKLRSDEYFGEWFSAPATRYQNMVCSGEVDRRNEAILRRRLAWLAKAYIQTSIHIQSGVGELIPGVPQRAETRR